MLAPRQLPGSPEVRRACGKAGKKEPGAPHTAPCAEHPVLCTACCAPSTLRYPLHTPHCTARPLHDSVHRAPCIPHAPSTHAAPCTVRSAPYTLHRAPCTPLTLHRALPAVLPTPAATEHRPPHSPVPRRGDTVRPRRRGTLSPRRADPPRLTGATTAAAGQERRETRRRHAHAGPGSPPHCACAPRAAPGARAAVWRCHATRVCPQRGCVCPGHACAPRAAPAGTRPPASAEAARTVPAALRSLISEVAAQENEPEGASAGGKEGDEARGKTGSARGEEYSMKVNCSLTGCSYRC